MRPFLSHVAGDLRSRWGVEGLSEGVLYMASDLSKRYFSSYLSEDLEGPVWMPRYGTLLEAFESFSGLRKVTTLEVIPTLHGVFRELPGRLGEEAKLDSLEAFYPLGELLLSDYEAVDMQLCDARVLFQNIQDLKEIEERFASDDEVRALLETFVQGFSVKGRLQENFEALWGRMYPVYEGLQRALAERGVGYNGMVFRRGLARLLAGEVSEEVIERFLPARVAFVGFDAFSRCEEQLLDYACKRGKERGESPLFYWDYHRGMLAGAPSGAILRPYLARFGDATPAVAVPGGVDCVFTEVRVPGNLAQADVVESELAILNEGGPCDSLAVVLADEALLDPLTRSLDASRVGCNVVMGYPLAQTSTYALCEAYLQFLRAQEAGYDSAKEWRRLLSHPLLQGCEALLAVVGEGSSLERLTNLVKGLLELPIEQESEHRALLVLEREIEDLNVRLLASGLRVEEVSARLLLLVVRREFKHAKIAYKGDSIKSTQILGFLATRTLDFQRLILLSAVSGVLPPTGYKRSFIPYTLRRAYGLPTQREEETKYAYFFEALCMRAERVTLLYPVTEDQEATESPFLLQQRYRADRPIEMRRYASAPQLTAPVALTAPRTAWVGERLEALRGSLSASGLNSYIDCPLRFYLKYVANVAQEQEPQEELLSTGDVGKVLHNVLMSLYAGQKGHPFSLEKLGAISEERISEEIERAIGEVCADRPGAERPTPAGQLYRRDILRMVQQVLRQEANRSPRVKAVEQLEESSYVPYAYSDGGTVTFKGILDRVDRLEDGTAFVVDYKTGKYKNKDQLFKKLEDGVGPLFADDRPSDYGVQVMLYALMTRLKGESSPIGVGLWFPRAIEPGYTPGIRYKGDKKVEEVTPEDIETLLPLFEERLKGLLSELFDSGVPFVQTTNADKKPCRYCQYAGICATSAASQPAGITA